MSLSLFHPLTHSRIISDALQGGEDHWNQHSTDGNLNVVDLWKDDGPGYGSNGTYSTYLYTNEAVRIITQHNVSQPLFLYLPFHVTHTPLEAPPQYIVPVPQDPRGCFRG